MVINARIDVSDIARDRIGAALAGLFKHTGPVRARRASRDDVLLWLQLVALGEIEERTAEGERPGTVEIKALRR